MSRLTNKETNYIDLYVWMAKENWRERGRIEEYTWADKLQKFEDLLEKYEIEDLSELEIALDQYYHRCDNVQTRRVKNNEEPRWNST